MMSKNDLNKRVLEVNKTGILTNEPLLYANMIPEFVPGFKLHIHEIELTVSAAATVTLKIGNTIIFQRANTTANAEYHTEDDDNHNGNEDNQALSLTTSANVTVQGFIRYSFK